MKEIINYDVLILVGIAAFVLSTLFDIIKERLPFWKKMSDFGREIGGYDMIVLSAALMWFTGLNMLPGFSPILPWLGRLLTCVIAGFGPKLVYDLWLDRPAPPVTG